MSNCQIVNICATSLGVKCGVCTHVGHDSVSECQNGLVYLL